jgi:hypothetical protein
MLEPKDAVVFMLEDDVPDLAGIVVVECKSRGLCVEDEAWAWNWHGWRSASKRSNNSARTGLTIT